MTAQAVGDSLRHQRFSNIVLVAVVIRAIIAEWTGKQSFAVQEIYMAVS